jgi:hypothetical protein
MMIYSWTSGENKQYVGTKANNFLVIGPWAIVKNPYRLCYHLVDMESGALAGISRKESLLVKVAKVRRLTGVEIKEAIKAARKAVKLEPQDFFNRFTQFSERTVV